MLLAVHSVVEKIIKNHAELGAPRARTPSARARPARPRRPARATRGPPPATQRGPPWRGPPPAGTARRRRSPTRAADQSAHRPAGRAPWTPDGVWRIFRLQARLPPLLSRLRARFCFVPPTYAGTGPTRQPAPAARSPHATAGNARHRKSGRVLRHLVSQPNFVEIESLSVSVCRHGVERLLEHHGGGLTVLEQTGACVAAE